MNTFVLLRRCIASVLICLVFASPAKGIPPGPHPVIWTPAPRNPDDPEVPHPLPPSTPQIRSGIAVVGPALRSRVLGLFEGTKDPRAMKKSPSNSTTLAAATTGINPWWTYEEGALPGTGSYMVNVGTGNLVVQATDVDVPERGIDLALRRTYNSQSAHDAANSDSSVAASSGDGWTTTFDAHLAYDGTSTISVYDIDGARYDYTGDGSGSWVAPAGQHAVLQWDGACGYQWTKKNGTVYYFYSPDLNSTTNCTLPSSNVSAFGGRLHAIFARNHNNSIMFTYSWLNGDASAAANLTQIVATHSDGQALTLQFGLAAYGGPPELLQVTRPDGKLITYRYDGSGTNLQSVTRPGNSTPSVTESYEYIDGDLLHSVASPRYNATTGDGNVTSFNYDASRRVSETSDRGLVNFTPDDGTSTQLQPGAPGAGMMQTWRKVTYSGYGTGATSMTDTDGHHTSWSIDPQSRVTKIQEYNGATALTTTQSWDSDNNLISTVEPRGNTESFADPSYETDYAYDANGNMVAQALPTITTSNGTYRPTRLYSYDYDLASHVNYNNVIAYCDPVETHALGKDWTAHGPQVSDALCPNASGAQRFTWSHADTAQPFGSLTDYYTAQYGSGSAQSPGYHTHWSYVTESQSGGDYGLPTSVTGDAINELDGNTVTPAQSFVYDSYGNLICYSKLHDGNGSHWWRMSYDDLHRQTSVADPDDASVSEASCPNNGSAGSTIVTRTTYYDDGTVASVQSPSEFAQNVATAYTYDADGDELSETHHYGNITGTTFKTYDGADRLVEVHLPPDDGKENGWLPTRTRYIYDVSQGGSLTIGPAGGISAHGNLYKTQICYNFASDPACQWNDVKGSAFDALDRQTARYAYSPSGGLQKWTYTHDGAGAAGLLSSTTDPVNATTTYSYDADSRESEIRFSDSTPSRTYTYDADGRTTAIRSSKFGTSSTTYDMDGNVLSTAEARSGGVTSPASITYEYYGNGWQKDLHISAAPALPDQTLFKYAYRSDGLRTWLSQNGYDKPFAWAYSGAGRVQSAQDPFMGGTLAAVKTPSYTLAAQTLLPLTFSYDARGQLSSETLPGNGQYSNIQHDAEGNMIAASVTDPPFTGSAMYVTAINQQFDVRNEFVRAAATNKTISPTYEPYASENNKYGYMCNALGTFTVFCGNYVVDPNTGAQLSESLPGTEGVCNARRNAQYDDAGRLTGYTFTEYRTPSGCEASSSMPESRTYDAENHIISDVCGSVNPCTPYTFGWGPDGHVATFGPYTAHWNGDQLLFLSDSSGALVQLNTESLAVQTPRAGLIVYSRSPQDEIAESHSAHGTSGWNVGTTPFVPGKAAAAHTVGTSFPGYTPFIAPVLYATLDRRDGYKIGALSFQGVRTYDQTAQQWTTPDAYAGEIHDPMSQRPYMWNHNNPVAYEDPSGYEGCMPGTCGLPPGAGCNTECARTVVSALAALAATIGEHAGVLAGAAALLTLKGDSGPPEHATPPEHTDLVDEKETRSTDSKELKSAGINAHDVKESALGDRAKISQYDIRVVKSTGELAIFKKGARIGIATGERIVKK